MDSFEQHSATARNGREGMEQQPVFKGFDEEGFAVYELPFQL